MRQRFLVFVVLALVLALPAGAQTFEELFNQGIAAYEKDDFPRCAERFGSAGKAAAQDRQAARAFFAAAACSVAAGQRDAAFGYLDQAAARGHDDVDRATSNPQMQALQDDPRWKSYLQGVEVRHAEREKKNNAELTRLYEEDQADRAGGPNNEKTDWAAVSARDTARQERVHQIVAEGGARSADDYYHAAMVFQHGDTDEEIAKAHELSVKAAELDPEHPSARWLAAASKDRLLMRQGKPQLYGTQFRKVDGKWILHEVDPSVTDEERAKWDCPPLAEARKRVETLNAAGHP